MDSLRQRHDEAKLADDVRNTLIEDLLQKVDDMQKTMDRNAFVMVLIDGDCMNFTNELVKQGVTGGDEAAKRLQRAVFEYLRYDKDFKHDNKIVIRVYANLRGLSKTYVDMGILPNSHAFDAFVLGFTKALPLCDFIDAGNHKEAADTKLKAILSLYVYNVHCKQIVFGASSDNAYASFLSSFFLDTDVSSRIRILKGPPFSFEFKNIISRFKWTEFKNVFRSESLVKEPAQPWRRSQETVNRFPGPLPSTTKNSTVIPWRPRKDADLPAPDLTFKKVGGRLSPDLPHFSSPESPKTDEDSDGDGVVVGAATHDGSTGSSPAASGQMTPLQLEYGSPTARDVEAALTRFTNRGLNETPLALDFGAVKKRVEQELGLTSDFWGHQERDEWFTKSKQIIKNAIEKWVERTNNPPPKNATWMLRFFNDPEESPSAAMQRIWQGRSGSGSTGTPTNEPTAHGTSAQLDAYITANRLSAYVTTKRPASRPVSDRICLNAEGRRLDIPMELQVNSALINSLRNREKRFCNAHHLVRGCITAYCPYDHDTELSDHEFEALLCLSRSQRCSHGSACASAKCTKGHMCPNGANCRFGSTCKFAEFHGIDTVVAEEVMER